MAIDYAALNALTTDWGRETADLDSVKIDSGLTIIVFWIGCVVI